MIARDFGQDIRLAVRGLRRKPFAAALGIATLAVGIGATTSVFSVLDAIAFRDLPVRNPKELTELAITFGSANTVGFSVPMVRELSRTQRAFSNIVGFASDYTNAEIGTELTQVNLLQVTGDFFGELGIRPAAGRLVEANDMSLASFSGAQVAVLGHGFWQRRYNGDPAAVGTTIRIDGKPYTIVGIAPPGFSAFNRFAEPDISVPIAADSPAAAEAPGMLWIHLIGRLKPGVSIEQARAVLGPAWTATKADLVPATYAAPRRANFLALGLNVRSAQRGLEWDGHSAFMQPLWFVLALALIVMAVTCLNVAGLMLARTGGQAHDIGIRLALGATAWTIRRQAIAEALVLSLAGSGVGLLIARWSAPLVARFMLKGWLQDFSGTMALQLTPDAHTFGLVGAIVVAVCVLFATMPTWQIDRRSVAQAFQGGSRVSVRIGRLAPLLVAAQVALGLVASLDAGLLVRTLQHFADADTGFARANLNVAELMPQPGVQMVAANAATNAYDRQLLDGIRAATGVRSVALSAAVPLRGADWTRTINAANAPGNPLDVTYDSVSPEFADFLGLSVREGRDFTWSDDIAGPRVAIVSESLARRIAPGKSALGEYINFGPTPAGQHIQIVGVVKDFKFYDAKNGSPLVLLMPLLQNPEGTLASVLLRGPVSVVALRRAVSSLGHEYVWRTQSIDEIVQASARLERFAAIAGSLFGGVGISLAALGLYGLLTHAVLRRTREFAIRAALGGRARAMAVLVLKQGFAIATVGAAIGVVVAIANVRWLQSLLFGVTVRDALSLSIVPVALAVVAVAACVVPAVRAAQIDPLILMREE